MSNGKEIVISGPDDVHYENILAFSNIDKNISVDNSDNIKIYWKKETYEGINGSNITKKENVLVNFEAIDENNNGFVDYVEWVVPHLSNQTYELIIEISDAQHLDSNRSFITDVYDFVKERDSNFVLIPAGDYLRVTFEQLLDSSRDITIYARAGCNESILINGTEVPCEIYEKKMRIDEIRKEKNG